MNKKILIFIESNSNVSNELAIKAQELSTKLDNAEIVGFGINIRKQEFTLFDKIYYIDNEKLKNYISEYYLKIFVDLIKSIKPEIVLIGATALGRDLAPQIASALHTGLTADCTELDINEDGKLAATRPTFGGKLMATILSKNNPQMATVRPNVIRANYNFENKKTEYINFDTDISSIISNKNLIEIIKKDISEDNIESTEIIVAAGRGIKDNMDLVYKLAEKLNGRVGVSRSLVDMGLAKTAIQIGQTGKTVSPKIYIAIGISGAIQHTVGIMGAKKIIAINKDKSAPIFKLADFGIVGDSVEILKSLIDKL